MRIDFTRCALAALLSLGLVSCASGNNSKQEPQTNGAPGAQFECNFVKFSSIASSTCSLSDLHRTTYLVVQTTPERASEECKKLVDFASSQLKFQPRWTLEIMSPASEDSSCTLQFPNLADVPTPLWPVIEEVLLFAISIYPQEAKELLQLVIIILEQMRAHLAEMK
jgi:hypothetical protein